MPTSSQDDMVDSGVELVGLADDQLTWSGADRTRYDQLRDFRRLSQVPVPTVTEVTSMDALRTTLGYT